MVLRRLGGVLLLLIGAAGLIGCAVVFFQLKNVGLKFDQIAGKTFDAVEISMGNLKDKVDKTALSLVRARSNLQKAISEIESFRPDIRAEQVAGKRVTGIMNSEVRVKLGKAQAFLASASGAVSALRQLLQIMDTWGLLDADNGQAAVSARIEKTSLALSRVSARLDDAIKNAWDLQYRSNAANPEPDWTVEIKALEDELSGAQSFESDFNGIIKKTETRLREYQEKAIRWIRLGNMATGLLLIWIGAGQAAIMIIGIRLMAVRKRR